MKRCLAGAKMGGCIETLISPQEAAMNPCALGWDNHRKFSKVSVMEQTPEGEIRAVERARLEHDDKQAMRAWLSHLDPEIPVALEATFGWPWVADLLEELGHPVHLAHPPVIRALAKHEAKTDRCDSDRLGKFQLRGILPESYLAPPEVRQRRERTRYRMALSALRTAVKNRAQAVLHRHGILHDFSDLFGKAGRRFLDDLALPEGSRQALQGCLQLLDSLTLLIDEVEQWMVENLEEDDLVRLLMTIPGVGLILAHVIRAEIGEIERFPTFRHLASYAGLAPMSDDTAGREGPRHCSSGLQPRAALGLHRGRAWRATHQRPARFSAAAALRATVRHGPAEGPQEFGESGRGP